MRGRLEKWPCCCKSRTLEQNRVQKRAKTRVQKRAKTRVQKRPPSPVLGEGSPTKTDYRKTVGTLILTSPLEDLGDHSTTLYGAPSQESEAVRAICSQRWRNGGGWLWQDRDRRNPSARAGWNQQLAPPKQAKGGHLNMFDWRCVNQQVPVCRMASMDIVRSHGLLTAPVAMSLLDTGRCPQKARGQTSLQTLKASSVTEGIEHRPPLQLQRTSSITVAQAAASILRGRRIPQRFHLGQADLHHTVCP